MINLNTVKTLLGVTLVQNVAASAIAFVLRTVLGRKELVDIIDTFNKVETELLAYLARKDAAIEAMDGQIIALLDARGASAEEAARAQRILGRVGALTA